tara:strand:+ start:549 stop:746 length:198 start_codon:yes stop_codon:yes gene_type:complete
MPCAIPTLKEIIIKAIKAFNLKKIIKMNKKIIPRLIINNGIIVKFIKGITLNKKFVLLISKNYVH